MTSSRQFFFKLEHWQVLQQTSIMYNSAKYVISTTTLKWFYYTPKHIITLLAEPRNQIQYT